MISTKICDSLQLIISPFNDLHGYSYIFSRNVGAVCVF